MWRRKTTMRLCLKLVTLISWRPVTHVLLSDTCQIRLPMMLQICSTFTFQTFLYKLSGVHLEPKVLKLIFVVQSCSSHTRTWMYERPGLRNTSNGQFQIGGPLTSWMNWYSMSLAQMGWSGAGGSLGSSWIHSLWRRRWSTVVGRLQCRGWLQHKVLATLYASKETSTRSYTVRYCRMMSLVVTIIFILIVVTTISSRTTIQSIQQRLFRPGF